MWILASYFLFFFPDCCYYCASEKHLDCGDFLSVVSCLEFSIDRIDWLTCEEEVVR